MTPIAGRGPRAEADAGRIGLVVGAWFLFLVGWLVLTPSGSGADRRIDLWTFGRPIEALGNLLLLAPLALVGVTLLRERARGLRTRVAIVTLLALALSVAIEAAQWTWTGLGRTVSISDVLLNGAGALAAAGLGAAALERGVPGDRLIIATFVAVLSSVTAYGLVTTGRAAEGFRIAVWDAQYEVLAGDELGGERTYRGRVDAARVCAGSAPTSVCAAPGADLEERQQIVLAAERSQRTDVSATVVSGSDFQSGPARIVTFSGGIGRRNLTLAQENRDLVLRVRSGRAGWNGSRIHYVLPEAVATGELTRVKATFDRGTARLESRDGVRGRRAATFPVGLLTGWNLIRPQTETRALFPDAVRWIAVAGAFVYFPPIGIGLALLRDGARKPFGEGAGRTRLGAFLAPAVAALAAPAVLIAVDTLAGTATAGAHALLAAGVAGLAAASTSTGASA